MEFASEAFNFGSTEKQYSKLISNINASIEHIAKSQFKNSDNNFISFNVINRKRNNIISSVAGSPSIAYYKSIIKSVNSKTRFNEISIIGKKRYKSNMNKIGDLHIVDEWSRFHTYKKPNCITNRKDIFRKDAVNDSQRIKPNFYSFINQDVMPNSSKLNLSENVCKSPFELNKKRRTIMSKYNIKSSKQKIALDNY